MRLGIIMFIYGFVGSFMVDLEKVYLESGQSLQIVGFANAYRQPGFWILRVVHSMGAGFLAVAWGQSFPQTTPLMLMAVGGAAGLIVNRFGHLIAKSCRKDILSCT